MKAVVLAAGKSTRLRTVAGDLPKPMMKIGGRPLLEHVLLNLKEQGIKEILINLHYRPGVITDHFGDGRRFGLDISYSHEPEILGTAGALKKVADRLTDPFLVVYGDNYCRVKYDRLISFHQEKQALATVALTRGADACSGGIAKLDGEQRISEFLEKPRSDQVFSPWINAGIYLVEPRLIGSIRENSACDFGRDLFPRLLRSGERLYGYKLPEGLRGINTPQEYLEAKRFYRQAAAVASKETSAYRRNIP